jgi:Copper type II ascorbate-dependent monooxygenase, C-terminal domain
MSTRSRRRGCSTARVICCTLIAFAGSGCADTPPAEPLDAAISELSADATLDASGGDSVVEKVDQDGVHGALAELPFLSEMGDGTKNLILVDWEIPANDELYLCGRFTLPEDVYFDEVHPVNPVGTHHTALGLLDRPNRPDGVSSCDLSELGRRGIDASGVGTTGAKMPPGVAMKAERGAQLLLNLHLFNTTNAALRGRSGLRVATVARSAVTTLADAVIAGPTKLDIPPGRSVQTGLCTVEHDYQIFGLFPHMHEMGKHMRVVAMRATGGPVVLHDGPFDFTHQLAYAVDPPLALAAGDRIEIACTYDNTTGAELHFGESSTDEMCLVRLARFPGGELSMCPF